MTTVARNREPKRITMQLMGKPYLAIDPPIYSREEIGRKARALKRRLDGCPDARRSETNKFVRYMASDWGRAY
jgi:hypothetical protein